MPIVYPPAPPALPRRFAYEFGITPGATAAANLAAINTAHVSISAAGGGVLEFVPGSYSFTGQILWKNGVQWVGAGTDVTIIDFSGEADFSTSEGFILAADGSVSSSVNVTSSVSAGAVAIPVSSIVGYSPNDYIQIRSTEVLWSEATVGEIAHVQWADSGFIYLKSPLAFDYDTGAGTVTVVKLTTHTGAISDLTIKGKGINPSGLPSPTYTGTPSEVLPEADRGDLGVEIRYGKDWLIENVSFIDVEYRCVTIFSCIGTKVRDSVFRFDSINQLSQYGVAVFGANADTSVTGCDFYNGRHHVTTLSRDSTSIDYSRGMPVGIVMDGNTCMGSWTYPLDTHRAGSNVVISNNTISSLSGGIEVRTPNTIVTGNTIFLPIPNNAIAGIYDGHGIALYYEASNAVVSNNNIRGGNLGIVALAPTTLFENLVISGNNIQQTIRSAIYVEDAETVSVTGNICGAMSGATTSIIRFDDVKFGSIVGNTAACDASGSQSGIYLSGASSGDTTSCVVSDNIVRDLGGGGTITGIGLDNEVTNTLVGFNELSTCDVAYSPGTNTTNTVLALGYAGTFVLASGVITIPAGATALAVDTESAAATDDLDTISGGRSGQTIMLKGVADARVVTAKDGTGNLRLVSDFVMLSSDYTITLLKVGANWLEQSRSAN